MHTGIGLSTAADHIRASKEATDQARQQIGKHRIDVALVFSSVDFAHNAVLKTISELLGDIPVFGASTLGVISDRGIFKYSLAVLLLSMPKEAYFNVASVKDIGSRGAFLSGGELGEKLLYGCKGVHRTLSIVLSDGLLPEGEQLIYGLQERLGKSFPLVGACASDNLSFKKTYLYFGDEASYNSACGILLGGKWNFGLGVRHGWKPLGKPRRVTRSKGNIVTEIDNTPAAKVYEDYFAKSIPEFKSDLKRIGMLYPIGIKIPGEKEYLLRSITAIKGDSLVFQGDVPQESTIRLMIGTKDSCLEAAGQAASDVKRNLAGHSLSIALIFNSVSRFALMGRQARREIDLIKETLGKDVPLIGIYTYAEQAPLSAINYLGKSYFQSHTITILGIGK